MASTAFDTKFGPDFLSKVPLCPGVYRMYSAAGDVIYVGKAKNLRRRLAQYRNAKRRKRDKRMRSIVEAAVRIEWEVAETDLEACEREMRAIQKEKPKLNVVGSFTFLYPLLGIATEASEVRFCLTTTPEAFSGFQLFGAFRSREITGEAFFSLMRLFKYLGHRESPSRDEWPAYSYVFSFRRLPSETIPLWISFFRGESRDALDDLFLRLLAKPGARAKRTEVQEGFDHLERFWEKEASELRGAIRASNFLAYPVPQNERDPLFLFYRKKEV